MAMNQETLRAWLSAAGGRRFLLTLGSGVVTALLVAAQKITGEVYATVTIATVGSYIAGNVYQKRGAKTKEEADA